VLPKDPALLGNKKKIGFFHANPYDTAVSANNWLDAEPNWLTRQVKISLPDTNHMHNVPVLDQGYRWTVQWERVGTYKKSDMGWNYVNDTQSKRTIKFRKLEDCLVYCRSMGLAYEVSYPHFRYHTKKNYGDNFKWKGHPKTDDDF